MKYFSLFLIVFIINVLLFNSINYFVLSLQYSVALICGQIVLISLISLCFTTLLQRFLPKDFISSKGKAVLITGCDSGFGNCLALKLNEYGFRVYATVLDPLNSGSQELVENSRFSDFMKVIKMDVRNDKEVNGVYEEINNDLKLNGEQLWAIVNNAGIFDLGHIEWGVLERYKMAFEVNTFGVVRVTRTFLPLIRASKGRIVNVSSACGRVTFDNTVSYSMSKYAVISFSDALRREMHKWGVKVSTIEPGGFKTHMTSESSVNQLFDKTLNETTDSVRNAYGLKYFESQKKSFLNMSKVFNSGDQKIVVNDMLDAIQNIEPKISYKPSDGILSQIPLTSQYLPDKWMDRWTRYTNKSKPHLIKV